MDYNIILDGLHIPSSKREQLEQQYGREQVNTAHANYIIGHHPAPSWMIVANINVLWYYYATGALEMVQKSVYLKGESYSHS